MSEGKIKTNVNQNITKLITEEDLRNCGVYDEMLSWFNLIRDISDRNNEINY